MRKVFLLSLLTLVSVAAVSEAAPIVYVQGNECPTDANVGNSGNARQYSVPEATRCMYESGNNINPKGTQTEADLWLNSAAADMAGWGVLGTSDDWTGLAKTDDGNVSGFSFTVTETNSDGNGRAGTFLFGAPLTDTYNQFALAVKDGGAPKFAIFELPVDTFFGHWLFESNGGTLSHFAFYGRFVEPPPCTVDCGEPDPQAAEVPEPATLLLIGSGLTFAARRKRAKR